nr:suppressor of ABI3-5 isoform X1 [Tanacetum cinerariifolium]
MGEHRSKTRLDRPRPNRDLIGLKRRTDDRTKMVRSGSVLVDPGGMDSMPFPPGVGGCGARKGNSSAQSFEVITAEKAIDETNAGNYMLHNMGWQEGLDLQLNSHTIDAKMEMFEMVNDTNK